MSEFRNYKMLNSDGGSQGEAETSQVAAINPDKSSLSDEENKTFLDGDFDDCRYKMDFKNQGKCVIFNQNKFNKATKHKVRIGSEKDTIALKDLFEKLHFSVVVHEDLGVSQIYDKLNQYAAKEDHSDSNCFVLVFMSHGDAANLHAKDGPFPPQTLYEGFVPKNCKSLAGKPKMFFIQACRGDQQDEGHENENADSEPCEDSASYPTPKIPNQADFLICWGTFPGHAAGRYVDRGSWFIQSLVKVFEKKVKKEDVLSMMTHVNRHMNETYGNKEKEWKQVCFSQTSLMGKIFLAGHREVASAQNCENSSGSVGEQSTEATDRKKKRKLDSIKEKK